MSPGRLYLVATPIGNLEDITLRALRVLKEADLIACEDTRHTAKLLTHFGISTPRESFHEHNESARTPKLIELLKEGRQIALVSDAGTPLISDPGYTLVSRCREEGIEVVPVPGPVAAIAALSASGLPTDSFYFAGYLPSRAGPRKKKLELLAGVPATLIFYEAPHRLLQTLEAMLTCLGPRRACLVREITKLHEEWLRGNLHEIFETLRRRPAIRGEITLIIDRASADLSSPRRPDSIREHLAQLSVRSELSAKEALRIVAKERGISRREAYSLLLQESGKSGSKKR